MADEQRADDLARLDDARHVLGEGSHAIRQSLYAVYVTILLALTYGLTVSRAVFLTAHPDRVRDQLLAWPVLVGVVVAIAMGSLVAHRAGRTRGPVVPPLPWIDVVLPSPIDRALSMRRWWGFALVGALTGGVTLGGVIGGGLWFAHVGGPVWLVGGVTLGTVVALLLLTAWLAGQLSLTPPDGSGRTNTPRKALRRLPIEDLRRHAVRSTRLGGAVLVGDVRAIRLEVSAPVTRGRHLRLRAAGPTMVVARRDVLGLRRMPGGLASGAVLTALGSAVVGWVAGQTGVPPLFGLLGAAICYTGYGAWAEGLRSQGDNAGTPPLIGLDTRHEAAAHLITPTVLFVVVGAVVGGTVALASGASGAGGAVGWAPGIRVAAWAVPLAGILAGCHLLAAFRGSPPVGLTGLRSPWGLALWLGLPLILTALVGGLLTAAVAGGTDTPWILGAGAVWALVSLGMWRARALANAHRI